MKISSLELENVKRIKAVKVEPTQNGLTVIGGNNNQGKTSVLDAIAWALGGNTFKPSQPNREGSTIPPYLKVTLDNGIIVERKGKNSDLKVTDSTGKKAGQALLNEFINQLALDLPKFMNSSNQDKAKILLNIIGVGEELRKLEQTEKELYQSRLAVGRIADQKSKHAAELPHHDNVPADLISPSDLITQQQEILARNGENARKRGKVSEYEYQVNRFSNEVATLQKQLEEKQNLLNQAVYDLSVAKADAMDLIDESTAELEQNLRDIETINTKVRMNLEKAKAEDEARQYKSQYEDYTSQLEAVREHKMSLLQNANLPLVGLNVSDGELTYNGQKWDNMSGSDQLKVSTAIVRKLNPNCGFVLMDKLEQMDMTTLNEFGKWLEEQGLQAIATRVSTGDECSVIIEDGYVVNKEPVVEQQPSWKAGVF